MNAAVTHFTGTLALLTLPFNLAAMVAGLLAGMLARSLAARMGIDRFVAVALLFPVAALLDPATALILLASAWAAALVASAPHPLMWRLLGFAALVAGTVLVAAGPGAALLPKLAAAEKVALLSAAAALAVMCHAGSRTANWAGALAMIGFGIVLELSPWHPIESAQVSPRAVLLGLLALGPAIAVLVRPTDAASFAESSPLAWPATLLPLLPFAMPVTATAALLALALAEHGLTAGHALMTQRPRLALALVLAPFVVALAAILILQAIRHIPRLAWTSALDEGLRVRLAATAVAAFALIALSGVGVEWPELIVLAVAAVIGGALHWFGQAPVPLVIGLTIGELMRPILAPALTSGITDIRSGLLVAFAGLVILAAFAWPWLRRAVRGRTD